MNGLSIIVLPTLFSISVQVIDSRMVVNGDVWWLMVINGGYIMVINGGYIMVTNGD